MYGSGNKILTLIMGGSVSLQKWNINILIIVSGGWVEDQVGKDGVEREDRTCQELSGPTVQ